MNVIEKFWDKFSLTSSRSKEDIEKFQISLGSGKVK